MQFCGTENSIGTACFSLEAEFVLLVDIYHLMYIHKAWKRNLNPSYHFLNEPVDIEKATRLSKMCILFSLSDANEDDENGSPIKKLLRMKAHKWHHLLTPRISARISGERLGIIDKQIFYEVMEGKKKKNFKT